MCFDFLYKCCWSISHSKKNSAMYIVKVYVVNHVKYMLLFSDINKSWIFMTHFQKKISYIKFKEK